jgi:acyl dehydratase
VGQFKVNDQFKLLRSFSSEEVQIFARLSNDFNPLHIDKIAAEKGRFGQRIVHGMLVSSVFSGIIANHIPGPGSVYLFHELKFLAPVFLNEKLEFIVTVLDLRLDKPIFTLSTICRKLDLDSVAVEGTAVVLNSEISTNLANL